MILLVTHQAEFRAQLEADLKGRGHEVLIPPHRQDVLDMMKKFQPQLVFVDLYVAQPGGLELLRTLRDQGYRGKVIILAGSSMRGVVPEAFRLGVHEVVGGPEVRGEHLVGQASSAIQRALKQLCDP